MRSRILISLSALVLLARAAIAQSADDYFHGGAMSYLSNNVPVALGVVTNGLERYPDDTKLQKLYELLKQQQQQQQQQNQQDQQDQQEQKQDQQKQDKKQQEQKQQQSESEQKQDQQQQKQPEKGQEQQKPEEQRAAEGKEMTPQEARQLLDAQKGNERVLVFRPEGEPKNRDKKLKDW